MTKAKERPTQFERTVYYRGSGSLCFYLPGPECRLLGYKNGDTVIITLFLKNQVVLVEKDTPGKKLEVNQYRRQIGRSGPGGLYVNLPTREIRLLGYRDKMKVLIEIDLDTESLFVTKKQREKQ